MAVQLLALVVNPKLAKPALVTWEGREINIYRADAETDEELEIPYEGDYSSEHAEPAEATGFPRVHTPDGVQTRGAGYGTCLYAGLAVGAYAETKGLIRIGATTEGPGISSSTDSRSREADAWWERAKEHGLASGDVFTITKENENLDVSSSKLNDCGIGGGKISYVHQVEVDLEYNVEADVLPYDSLLDANLVLAVFGSRDLNQLAGRAHVPRFAEDEFGAHMVNSLWRDIASGKYKVREADADALAALDVRGIAEPMLNLVLVCAAEAGLEDGLITGIRARWELNLDPSTPIRQQSLPFSPNGPEAKLVREVVKYTGFVRDQVGWNKLKALP